ncbi:MAG: alpha/beta hydrolase [Actinobacteria bacterium]|nr:alpha/beta hydrolase [Actinomycetota bacterium]
MQTFEGGGVAPATVQRIHVDTPAGRLHALTWGPSDAPIALCLHGFPDSAHGWRKVAPILADAGWRVVAPFMRGYAPSSVPSDSSYHIGALMDDALRVLAAVGPTGRDVLVGHDWGAMTGAGLAALPDSPFSSAVLMSVPPSRACWPRRGTGLRRSLPVLLPPQLLRFWYLVFFQLPWLPERFVPRLIPLLWRRWSPGYDAHTDLPDVLRAIGAPDNIRAAVSAYRHLVRQRGLPGRYAPLHPYFTGALRVPTLYLHGSDDGCMSVDFAYRVPPVLPPGGDLAIVARAGHFLQLEQPEVVARRILDFVGPAR